MRARLLLLPLSAATALAGCALGPRPAAPVPPVPSAAWNGSATAVGWPSEQWWKGFNAPELDRLIAAAQANNDDLAAAQARVRQADAQARIAGAALLPSLDAAPVGEYQRRLNPTGVIRQYGTFDGVLSASYELDVWGKNHDAHRAAIETAQAARYSLDVTRLTIIASVASTYFTLLATDDQIALVRSQATVARKILNGLVIQQQHGIATGLQVTQQRVVAEQLDAQLPDLIAQRAHLADALALLTGQLPEGFTVTGGSLANLTLPVITAGIPSDLLVHRPDVQAAERALAAAGANISVARKSFLPSFNLTGTGGIGSLGLGSAAAGPIGIWDLTAGILAPIFEGGRLRGQLEQANGRYQELAANYLKAVRSAYGDVEDALAAESGAREAVARQTVATASARDALKMAQAGVTAGTTDQLPLLTAQQTLAAAQGRQVQAALAQAQGLVDLYKALGGGWQAPEGRFVATSRK